MRLPHKDDPVHCVGSRHGWELLTSNWAVSKLPLTSLVPGDFRPSNSQTLSDSTVRRRRPGAAMEDQELTKAHLEKELSALRRELVEHESLKVERDAAVQALQESEVRYETMAARLTEAHAGLEQKVEARTEELRETNETLSALIEASPLAIGVLDRDRNLRSWNKAGERMFGWTEAEALAHEGPLLAPEENRDEALLRQRRLLSGESLLGLELRHRRKDGSPIDVEVWAAPLRDTQGEINGSIVIYADITERQAAQEALRQAEEKYRSIFENSVEGIFQLAPDGQIISGNPALARIFGFESLEEITHLTRLETAYFHDLSHLIREQGSVLGYEVQEERQDGSPMWISISARAVYDQLGELAYYEGTVQDITEHKRAEEALRESEEEYRSLFNDSKDAIFVTARDGAITDVNRAALDLFGYTREEIIGFNASKLCVDVDDHARLVQEADQQGLVRDFEIQLIDKDGTKMDCLVTASIRRDSEGRIVAYQGVARDITERKQAEQTLLEQTRELAVLEERNRFAREIHDTLAQGFAGIVLQLEAAEQVLGDTAPEVQDHMARAKGLARDSLQEARRSVWDLLPQALEQLPLDTAIREEVRRRFDAQGSFSVSGEQRPLSSSVQTALLRICQEALTNISRHAAATRVSVKMVFHPDAIHLEVRDDGIGFDRELSGASQEPGSGFGLIGMEQRARQLGGTIVVSSKKGQGTVVEAKIPTA